ncbi:MAG: hypothetical protein ABMA64_29040 [Myxococcota bacterium]
MFDMGLMVGFAGIFVATLAGVLGVWMERERDNPPWWALFFSALIVFASFIELIRTVVSAWGDASTEDTMATILEQLTVISEQSDNPELASFVGNELSRSDPKLVKRVEKKVAAKGGDPSAVRRKAAEGRRATEEGRQATRAAGEAARTGKAAKAGKPGEAVEGKAGKVGAEGVEGKTGKTGKAADGESGAEGKAGKADPGAADPTQRTDPGDGKAGKAEGAEGKAGKAEGTEGKAGKVEGKAGKAE